MSITRQEKVKKLLVENHGNVSKSMREAGYTKAYASNPQEFKKTRTWAELMEEFMPESTVAEIHGQMLKASRIEHLVFPAAMSDDEIKEVLESISGCKLQKIKHGDKAKHAYFWVADNKARQGAIDMTYKLRGSYAAEKVKIENPIGDLSDAELEAALEATESERHKRFAKAQKKSS